MDEWIWWMIIAVVMAGLELAVFSIFIFGPLALAAVVTAAVAAVGASTEVQLAVFILLSLASMLALYPVSKRHRESDPELATNVDALIGRHARVLETLTADGFGLIRLDGDNWTARPDAGGADIPPDTQVEIVRIAGATAIVRPLDQTEGAAQ